LQCVAACCSVLQRVAVLLLIPARNTIGLMIIVRAELQCVAVCCSVLQRVAVLLLIPARNTIGLMIIVRAELQEQLLQLQPIRNWRYPHKTSRYSISNSVHTLFPT